MLTEDMLNDKSTIFGEVFLVMAQITISEIMMSVSVLCIWIKAQKGH